MSNIELIITDVGTYCLIMPLFLIFITLIIGWIVHFFLQCWRLCKEYQTCKRTPVLHPLYSDVQYLSKQRKLYNLKTHITKYSLMILCSSVELAAILGYIICVIIRLNASELPNHTKLLFGELTCFPYVWPLRYLGKQINILILNVAFCLSNLLVNLLGILSRYLAARYINHPFKRTLIKYIIWCLLQCIFILFCSTSYTWVFLLLIVPFIGVVNWILLLRDTSFLSRVLRSNLIDIQLYSDNRVFYIQQMLAFKFYRLFRIVSLTLLFLKFLIEIGWCIGEIVRSLFFVSCFLQLQNGVNISLSIPNNFYSQMPHLLNPVENVIITSYITFLCLPLCGITFVPIILKCVKRCREKEDQYRYNYEKLKPLLKNYI